jgi:hypothetical protein
MIRYMVFPDQVVLRLSSQVGQCLPEVLTPEVPVNRV